ncbi:MAG: hypothetical protein NTX65_05020 [Ignavibacteriales bacterium]|nr:hypothetical protein [Ignavibacteriales bacterium]
MNGEKYLGNKNTKEVHDLDNEKKVCQIDEIINAANDVPFTSLLEAYIQKFDNCAYCIGNSKR